MLICSERSFLKGRRKDEKRRKKCTVREIDKKYGYSGILITQTQLMGPRKYSSCRMSELIEHSTSIGSRGI